MQAQSTVVYEQAYTIIKLSAPVADWCSASIPGKHFRNNIAWKISTGGQELVGCDECMSLFMRNHGHGLRLPTSRECVSEITKSKSGRSLTPKPKPESKPSKYINPITDEEMESVLSLLDTPLFFSEIRDRTSIERRRLSFILKRLRQSDRVSMQLFRPGCSVYVKSDKKHFLTEKEAYLPCRSPSGELLLNNAEHQLIVDALSTPKTITELAQELNKERHWVAGRLRSLQRHKKVVCKQFKSCNLFVRSGSTHLLDDFQVKSKSRSFLKIEDRIQEILRQHGPMTIAPLIEILRNSAPVKTKKILNLHPSSVLHKMVRNGIVKAQPSRSEKSTLLRLYGLPSQPIPDRDPVEMTALELVRTQPGITIEEASGSIASQMEIEYSYQAARSLFKDLECQGLIERRVTKNSQDRFKFFRLYPKE